ncbi:MAG: hypothetical protein DWH91_03850 [Planctomycetota bacterium]|nr:MAG: hypothetical protein DWH91_03850 [Planctomycetota bacterium]
MGIPWWIGCLCLCGLVSLPLAAEEMTARDAQRYGVDIIQVKGGVELRGAVLRRDPSDLQIAVQRSWLRTVQPAMLETADQEAAQRQAAAHQELLTRIESWIAAQANQPRLRTVLQGDLARLKKLPEAPPEPTQFVLLRIPTDRVRRVFTAGAPARQVAMVAWSQQLDRVEQSTITALKPEVEKAVPDWATQRVDLSGRLPAGEPQSADEWAARQAIFEYEYGDPLEFQGTGNLLFRTGSGAEKPDLSSLLASTAGETLASELGALGLGLGNPAPAPPTDWKMQATEQARKLNRSGFSVTRIPRITGGGPATVSIHFWARLADGQWHPIWSDEVTTDPSTIKADELKRLEADPQVQEILQVTKALSLDDASQQALRFGAAVQTSQQAVTTRFFEFRQRYNARLDGPPLVWNPE